MESLEKEGVNRLIIAKPNQRNIQIHSATSSFIIELYEKWYTFPDFFPNLDSPYIKSRRWKDQQSCDERGGGSAVRRFVC